MAQVLDSLIDCLFRSGLVFEPPRRSKSELVAPVRQPVVASPYLTIAEAADYTRLAVGTLYNAVHRGRLQKQPGSRKVLFTREELDRFVGTRPRRRR